MILECTNCLCVREGDFSEANPPGTCSCGTKRYWRVIKARRPPGYVKVSTHEGTQELHGPYWRIDPKKWK